MNVLGISCHYHDSAACLVVDGVPVAAAQEERYTRVKHCSDFPIHAINDAIQRAGLSFGDIDAIAFYEKPCLKFARVVIGYLRTYPRSFGSFLRTMPHWLQDRLALPLVLKSELGFTGKVYFLKHHLSHAAAAFLPSPFERAAVLTADGVGEWACATLGRGEARTITVERELRYPHSLGLVYSAVTTYLGFQANGGEGKVMGLAGYGKPRYLDRLQQIVEARPDASFRVDPRFFSFMTGGRMYTRRFVREFGPERQPGDELDERHADIAASLQALTEARILALARHLQERTGLTDICLAGGLFLNCIVNQKILEETPFKRCFIQPAAGDAGGALGAALYTANVLHEEPRTYVMHDACLGPAFSDAGIERALAGRGLSFRKLEEETLYAHVARAILDNKIVGWFQGRMEFGPRALGNRSILANPCRPDMKDALNTRVKKRESFRPYAPAVLEEKADAYFHMAGPSPFMLLAPRVRAECRDRIPAVTHIDGTARVQTVDRTVNPRFRRLIEAFEAVSGVPVLLNTSLNLHGEAIACSPEDALHCFQSTEMDMLVLGRCVLEKGET